ADRDHLVAVALVQGWQVGACVAQPPEVELDSIGKESAGQLSRSLGIVGGAVREAAGRWRHPKGALRGPLGDIRVGYPRHGQHRRKHPWKERAATGRQLNGWMDGWLLLARMSWWGGKRKRESMASECRVCGETCH